MRLPVRRFILFCFLILPACTEIELASHVAKQVPLPGESKSEGTFKVGNPYTVEGKWYRPKEDYRLVETGIASWYGDEFHGKPTANGEIFDMHELTAAHRTLQMPSLVRVTNLENGRSLIVRVNDRGPFKRGRVMDLSKRAAELLGFRNKGTAKVRLEVLAEESRAVAMAARRGEDTSGIEVAMNDRLLTGTPPAAQARKEPPAPYRVASVSASAPPQPLAPAEGGRPVPGHVREGNFYPDPVVRQRSVSDTTIYVQAGSFSSRDNAARLAESLRHIAGPVRIQDALVRGRTFYRVRIAAPDVPNADMILARVVEAGHPESIIVVE